MVSDGMYAVLRRFGTGGGLTGLPVPYPTIFGFMLIKLVMEK